MDEYIPEALRRDRDRTNLDWQRRDLEERIDNHLLPGAAVITMLAFSAGLTLGAIIVSFAWRML